MFWRTVLLVGLGAIALSIPVPQGSTIGAFQPLHGARGPTGPNSGYDSLPAPSNSYSGSSGVGGGGSSGPSKTIYVNVPPARQAPAPAPIAAGPPRKHYKIVFIRAPAPPPAPQPILPPRTEQKTLIYVLHQRPEAQTQEVIEVPTIKHNPEVYFVQYDNPPTAEELQQLTAGAYGPQLQSGILPQLDVDARDIDDDRSILSPGAGSLNSILSPGAGLPTLIQADEAALGALGPVDAPVFFSPEPAPFAPAPAPAPAFPLASDFFAPAPPQSLGAGIPLSAVIPAAGGGAPIDFGVPLDALTRSLIDPLGAIPLDQAAQIFDSPASGGIPLSAIIPSAPAPAPAAPFAPAPAANTPSVGVPLSAILGNSPTSGGVPIPTGLGNSPGGSTIAAGVLQNEGPQTFPFELNDAFGLRTVQRRR